MPPEEKFILSKDMPGDDPVLARLDDFIHKQKGPPVGEKGLNLIDSVPAGARRFLILHLLFL
jgi:hypothetical protein